MAPVSLHVSIEFGLPESLARGWGGRIRTPDVTVPEAAMDEAHSSELTKNQVRRNREECGRAGGTVDRVRGQSAERRVQVWCLCYQPPPIMRERVSLSTMSAIVSPLRGLASRARFSTTGRASHGVAWMQLKHYPVCAAGRQGASRTIGRAQRREIGW